MLEASGVRLTSLQVQLVVLLSIGVIIGGGGSPAAIPNLFVQLFALAVLAFNLPILLRFWLHEPLAFRALVGITLAIPLLQLIPLPPEIWASLPGRDLVKRSYDLVGEGDSWRAFSLTPNRTFIGFLALLPPLAVLVLASSLSLTRRTQMMGALTVLGLLNVGLGLVQVLSENRIGNLFGAYGYVVPDQLYGTFASHAAAGLFLVLALVALCGMPMVELGKKGVIVRAGIAVLLVLGVVLTQSRSAIALLSVPASLAFLRTLSTVYRSRAWRLTRRQATIVFVVIIGLIGTSSLIATNTRIAESLARFDSLEDARPGIWDDTTSAIDRYWPVGSGTGSFAEVFQVDESLENIQPFLAGRAHNDYLEVTLEIGLAGILILAAWALWLLWWVKQPGNASWYHRLVPFGGLVAIALQSLVDYPMRNEAILCAAALFVAMSLKGPEEPVGEGAGQAKGG